MKALVVGGTGPTGPHIVSGLRDRGYEVTILHRGNHEIPELDEFEHIHVDPHFLETLEEGLKGRTFDLAIGTYGRTRHVSKALRGKVGRFMAVSSNSLYRGYEYPTSPQPSTLPVATSEDWPVVEDEAEQKFSYLIASTEKSILEDHPDATIFRYSMIYGPRQLMPREWSVVRRVIEKRPHIILLNGGIALNSAMYSENAAHAILLAVDKPDRSAGRTYNMADTRQLSYRRIVEIISEDLNFPIEIHSVPDVGNIRKLAFGVIRDHIYLDTFRLRSDLGYQDIVDPVDGIRTSARWLLQNPPELGSPQDKSGGLFDYALEDQLIGLWRETTRELERMSPVVETRPMHAYAHPKEPGMKDQRGR